jgi:ferredoxin
MEARIKDLMEKNQIAAFLAYKETDGALFPHLFTIDTIGELKPWRSFDTRYPILKILLGLTRLDSRKSYAVMLRGCEERGLRELVKWGQIDGGKIVVFGQACSSELAHRCKCAKPYPDALNFGKIVDGIRENPELKGLEDAPREKRLAWWLSHFNRCIRCYGCRDVCPVCFCTDCSLEHNGLMSQGFLPPDTSFHLVRAVHMAGRCIDCGLCEESCPSRIPLRSLYKEVNEIVKEVFSYEPGSTKDKSPFSMLGEEALLPRAEM